MLELRTWSSASPTTKSSRASPCSSTATRSSASSARRDQGSRRSCDARTCSRRLTRVRSPVRPALEDRRIDPNLVRRHIALVFQSFNLFPHLSVLDNIVLGPVYAMKRKRAEVRERGARAARAHRAPSGPTSSPTGCRADNNSAWPSYARWRMQALAPPASYLVPPGEMLIRKAQSSKKVKLNVDSVSYWIATNNSRDNLKKRDYFARYGIAEGIRRLAQDHPFPPPKGTPDTTKTAALPRPQPLTLVAR